MQQKKQQEPSEVQLIICGVDGNMGKAIVQAVQHTPAIHIVAGIVAPNSPRVGKQAQQHWSFCHENFVLYGNLSHALKQLPAIRYVVLDFSVADICKSHVQTCQQHRLAYVTGVTGLQAAQYQALHQAAQTIPVLHAPNMSLGLNALHILCCLAAQLLPNADIEISELHHRLKRDHPSGSALWLGCQMAKSRGWPSDCLRSQQRQGTRKKQEIGIASLRGGDEPGAHTVHMLLQDEALQLTHRTTNRAAYAQGALLACQYIANQPAGQYDMKSVLKPLLHKNLQSMLDHVGAVAT